MYTNAINNVNAAKAANPINAAKAAANTINAVNQIKAINPINAINAAKALNATYIPCNGKYSCAGQKFAGYLSAPAKAAADFSQAIKDKLSEHRNKIVDILNNYSKCLSDPTSTKTGGGGAGGAAQEINSATESLKLLFKELGDREVKGYPNIFGPLEVLYAIVVINLQKKINKIILGDDAENMLADPNMTSKKLFDSMLKTSEKYKEVVFDSEFKQVFTEWINNYVTALLTTLDIAQPEIDRMNHKLNEIIETTGDNIGKSLIHALVNVARSAAANVPVVGGIVSLVLSADQIGKEIIDLCAPQISKGAGILFPAIDGINKQIEVAKCSANELAEKVKPMLAKKENTQQGGGASANSQKIKQQIHKTVRRINAMLMRFKGHKNRKLNYTRRRRLN